MTSARIFCIIVSKLGYQEEPCLIILLVVDKDPDVSLYGTVLPF